MQLHPDQPGQAVHHTVVSLCAGYIGLNFAGNVSDLMTASRNDLPENQRNYWAFAHEMKEDDRVLLFTHRFPFALARVAGPYNYISTIAPEINVWSRHFRKVDDVRYYGDLVTNAQNWEPIPMTATITPLRERDTESYRLIEGWLKE